MVRPPYFDSNGMKKGVWSEDEDNKLRDYILRFGHPNWRLLPIFAGLKRCGKSCRLRWVNYLKPGLKRGNFTKHEENRIIELHNQLGSKWSAIAAKFPGRTDNDIKNYWNAHIHKRGKRKIRTQTPATAPPQSFDHDQEKPPASEDVLFADQNAENIDFDLDRQPLFKLEEEFCGLGLCENDVMMSTFFDGGISCWNNPSSAADFLYEPVGEDFFDIQIWR